MNETESAPTAVLLSRDLFFTSKITGTAAALGYRVDTSADMQDAIERLTALGSSCLFVDLAMPDLQIGTLVDSLPAKKKPVIVAFGAHVDAARLEEARTAGCDEVLPRSRFSSTLPDILKRYLPS
jgi:CheY-like chemotaxis protein